MSNEQKLREALQGFLTAMEQGLSLHLAAEYARQALATTEPEPTGTPELHPVAHIELGDDSHDVVTLEAAKAYATAAVKQYKQDAERYRWLRDDTDSDWAICEWSHDPGDDGYYRDARAPHMVDAAIDAAMAKGVK